MRVLAYRPKDYMFIMVLTVFAQQFLLWLKRTGSTVFHLDHNLVYSYGGLGDFLRHLFSSQTITIILLFIIISHYLRRTPNLDWRIIPFSTFLITTISCSTLILNDNRFVFAGYTNLGTSILVYCFIALYLSFKLKKTFVLEKALLIMLALLTVSHVWEIPFSLMTYLNSSTHLYYWILAVAEWSIPVVFWFHATRKIYRSFIRNHQSILLISVSFIVTVTVGTFVFNLLYYWAQIGLLLRAAYALLLVFLPFHFYGQMS